MILAHWNKHKNSPPPQGPIKEKERGQKLIQDTRSLHLMRVHDARNTPVKMERTEQSQEQKLRRVAAAHKTFGQITYFACF